MSADGRAPIYTDKVIVLADLHMVPAGHTIIGIDPYERLRRAVDHINAHHRDAARVVVTGDLVHGGDGCSYQRVREQLERLRMAVSVMVGNHDDRDLLAEYFPAARCDESGFVQADMRVGDHHLILLDSAHAAGCDDRDGASGQLCATRLAWLDGRLRAAGRAPVVLFVHHPPMATGFAGMDAVRLVEHRELLDVVQRHGNVRHIVAGHVHRTISGSWHGLPFSIFKSTAHQQPMDLQSGSGSLSVDEPGAYGIMLFTANGIIVHTDDYDLADTVA